MSVKRQFDKTSDKNYKVPVKKTTGNLNRLYMASHALDSIDTVRVVYKRTEIIRDGRKFPVFQKPVIVGVFSVDVDRRFLHDASQLKYLYYTKSSLNELSDKRVNFNLNEGLKHCIRQNELINEKLDHIFEWIRSDLSKGHDFVKTDFVCFRGLLTTIMSTPYEQLDGWIICATQRNNTIFLCAFDTEKRKQEKENTSEKLKTFQSWGYKFEQFMLAEEPGQEPDTSKPVMETEEFCCMFRSKLNGHSITYGAEMDGVCSDEPVDDATLKTKSVPFVELKTSRHIETQRQDISFKRYKLLKWWCQSFLVGIETILCGFRDDEGVVSTIKEYRVRDLPKLAKGKWDSCVCMNFLSQFLDFVKTCVRECQDSTALWKFEWTPGNSITGHVVDGNSEFSFVPEWFGST